MNKTGLAYQDQIVETDNNFDFREFKACGELSKYEYIEIKFDFNPSFVIPAKINDIPERCYPEEGMEMEYEITAITFYTESENKRETMLLHNNFVDAIMTKADFALAIDNLINKYDEDFEGPEPDEEPDIDWRD